MGTTWLENTNFHLWSQKHKLKQWDSIFTIIQQIQIYIISSVHKPMEDNWFCILELIDLYHLYKEPSGSIALNTEVYVLICNFCFIYLIWAPGDVILLNNWVDYSGGHSGFDSPYRCDESIWMRLILFK